MVSPVGFDGCAIMGLFPMRTLPTDSHLLSRLESSLPASCLPLFQAVVSTSQGLGMPLFLVGGSIRDLLRQAPLTELDMAVEGDAIQLASEISTRTGAKLKSHLRFGVATLQLGGDRIDVATARTEAYSRPGALPKVSPSDIVSDLKRRDFTINAVALPLTGEDAGTLLDPLGGKHDLEAGVVRALYPNSFVDDPTRLFRAARYEVRLELSLEKETNYWLIDAVGNRSLDTVSGDRVRNEIDRAFYEPHPLKTLSRFRELGLLSAIHTSLGAALTPTLSQGERGPREDISRGSGMPGRLLWLAMMVYGVSSDDGTAIIQRLNMPSRWAKTVTDTVEVAARSAQELSAMSPQDLAEWLDARSHESIEAVSIMTPDADVACTLREYLRSWRNVRPVLTGRDLAALGAVQGPMMGDLIKELKDARITGQIRSREEETALARKRIMVKRG